MNTFNKNKVFYKIMSFLLILSLSLTAFMPTKTSVKAANNKGIELTTEINSWTGGYQMNVSMKNISNSTIDSWKLIVNQSDFQFTNIWSADYTASGDTYIITPASWSQSISAGGTITFGFNGTGDVPSNFSYILKYYINGIEYINGTESIVTPSPTIAPTATPTSTPTMTATPTPTVTPTPTSTPKFRVFLLLGQSNMAGYPKAQASDLVEDPRILVLGYDNNPALGRVTDQWDVACAPLHETWNGAVGPGDWFAKTLIQKLPAGDTIGLVPCAISGEKIETFMKGGSKYDWIIKRARLAQQKGGIIEGIIFHQGESNSGDPTWPNKVNTLVTDLRNDLNVGNIPFIAGELLYSGPCAGHNTLVNKLPSIITNCYVVSASGLVVDPSDSTWRLHFDHDSQVTLGKRYAAKMIEALGW